MISQENLIEKETIIFKDLSDILGPNVHEQSFVFKGFIFGICTKGYHSYQRMFVRLRNESDAHITRLSMCATYYPRF